MKKIVIMVCAVAFTAAIQAASFNWSTSAKALGVDAANVKDNGDYAASTTALNGNGTWSYLLTLFAGGEEVGSASGTAAFNKMSGKATVSGINIDAAAAGTTYDYTVVITGAQTDLNARGKDTAAGFDYTGASMTATLTGSVTTAGNGDTALATAAPANWSVTGITSLETPDPGQGVPEPTSGLLLVLGMAGLALRRKQK